MTIDYSKWDNLEVSDSDEDKNPRVIKLDRSERVELTRDGYNIVSDSQRSGKHVDFSDLVKYWKKQVKNGMVHAKSHLFSQDKYELTLLIAVNVTGNPRFEVAVTDTDLTIRSNGSNILKRELFSKVNPDEDMVTWEIVTKYVDWTALQKYCQDEKQDSYNNELRLTELYEQKFIEINLKKKSDLADCFLWWPKAFKDDKEARTFKHKSTSAFMDSWNKAHEQFKERVKNFEKVEL